MTCDHAREHLSPLLDHRLDPVEREELASHLASCQACRLERRALEASEALLGEASPPALDPALIERTLAAASALPRRGRLIQWAAPLAAAAALLILVGLATTRDAESRTLSHPTILPASPLVSHPTGVASLEQASLDLAVHALNSEVLLLEVNQATVDPGHVVVNAVVAALREQVPPLREAELPAPASAYLDRVGPFLEVADADPQQALASAEESPPLLETIQAARAAVEDGLPEEREDELGDLEPPLRFYVQGQLRRMRGDPEGAADSLNQCVLTSEEGAVQDAALFALSEIEVSLGRDADASLHSLALVGNGVYAELATERFQAAINLQGDALVNGAAVDATELEALLEALQNRSPVELDGLAGPVLLLHMGNDAVEARLEPELTVRRARGHQNEALAAEDRARMVEMRREMSAR